MHFAYHIAALSGEGEDSWKQTHNFLWPQLSLTVKEDDERTPFAEVRDSCGLSVTYQMERQN